MIALQITWLATCVLVASWTGQLVACNEVHWLRRKSLEMTIGVILAFSVIFHTALAIILVVYASIGCAIVSMSLVAFVWTTFSYFVFQRFAQPLEKPGVARQAPLVLPSISCCCFLSSVLSFVLFAAWYWAFLPVLIWLVLGFAAVEHMIRRWIARGYDRGLAISSINDAQGTHDFFDHDHYPFP